MKPVIGFIKFIMLSDADDGSFWQTQCLGSASSGYKVCKRMSSAVVSLLWSDHILQSQMPDCLALSLPRVFLSVPHALLGLCIVLEPWQFLA